MTPGQRLVASDGYEVMLFPLQYLYMSQDEGGDYSHAGTLSMDFLGWGPNGRILQCPYYAPCSCTCIASTESANRIWQSDDLVHLADGSLSKVCWVVAHDNDPPLVGTHLTQGQRMGFTGTAGYVTGDHVHLNIAKGNYANWERVPPNNNWQLRNSMHIYNACYVNDTTIVQGYGHNWITYDGPTPPPPTEEIKRKFPWVLYARKFRERRRHNGKNTY